MLECKTCDVLYECEFGALLAKKIRQIQINTRTRTKRVNDRYGYNTPGIKLQDVRELFRSFLLNGCTCAYCGRGMVFPPLTKSGLWSISLEHIKPLADGGTNDISNLTLCHTGCNHEQNKKTLLRKNGIIKLKHV